MSYTNANWTCLSASLNQGQETVTPFGGSPTVLNAPNLFIYGSPNDALATIAAADYFLAEYASLSVGDIILVNGTDASNMYIVATSSSAGVTVNSFTVTGSVATANIQNNAVTYAKIQETAAGSVLIGNPTGGAANVEEITLGNGLSFAAAALQLDTNYLNYAEVTITASAFNGMYAAPVLLVAAPGANELLVLDKLVLEQTYGSAAFAAGGVVAAQYDSTADGAGVLASASLSAASFFVTASNSYLLGGVTAALPFSTTVNKGLYLSNLTQAFTTGTGSTFTAKVWYKIVPTNS